MPLGKSESGPLPKDASLPHSGNRPPLPVGQNESAMDDALLVDKARVSSVELPDSQTNSASLPDLTHLPLEFSCLNSFTD